jgi:hypothetical protein
MQKFTLNGNHLMARPINVTFLRVLLVLTQNCQKQEMIGTQ